MSQDTRDIQCKEAWDALQKHIDTKYYTQRDFARSVLWASRDIADKRELKRLEVLKCMPHSLKKHLDFLQETHEELFKKLRERNFVVCLRKRKLS